jgi:hypothetical protein
VSEIAIVVNLQVWVMVCLKIATYPERVVDPIVLSRGTLEDRITISMLQFKMLFRTLQMQMLLRVLKENLGIVKIVGIRMVMKVRTGIVQVGIKVLLSMHLSNQTRISSISRES